MSRGQRLCLALLGVFALTLALPTRSFAHPLGNFTVNQYARIEMTTEGLRLVYVLDLAEIPALQEIQGRVDTDRDGDVSDGEREQYLAAKLDEIRADLRLTVDNVVQELDVNVAELTFPQGQAGLNLLRLRAELAPSRAPERLTGTWAVTFANDHAVGRLGWNEVVVTHGPGAELRDSDAPLTGLTDELRNYPEERLSSPLNRRAASFTISAAPGAPAAKGFDQAAFLGVGDQGSSGRAGGPVAALLTGQELSAAGLLLSFLLAAAWGAAHALSPGHGKTVVAAYLVGSRGTPRHALFLGATVTVTHTAGVLALGLITLFASRFILPEQLFPWLSLLSGLLVAGMGIVLLRQRLAAGHAGGGTDQHNHEHGHSHAEHAHDHDHDHDHDHAHGHDHGHDGHTHHHGGSTHSHLPPRDASLSWRSLLALGISGGLVPCPSALIVLLGAIALGQVGLGLALVGAFSLGLAAALTAIGLLFLVAGRFLEHRVPRGGRAGVVWRYAPVAGAAIVTVVGLGIVLRAVAGDGLF